MKIEAMAIGHPEKIYQLWRFSNATLLRVDFFFIWHTDGIMKAGTGHKWKNRLFRAVSAYS